MILCVITCLLLIAGIDTSATNTLHGVITDRTTGDPVKAATVRVEGTQLGSHSDKNGRFTIGPVAEGRIMLIISCIGYETIRQSIFIRPQQTDAVITLAPTSIVARDVVVTASKRTQAVQDVPISVAILTAADFSDRAITRLDEALRYVPGMTVVGDQVNIRGASGFALGVGSRTAVLLDGFPLMSGDNGDVKFDVLPVADLEKVEIIKGAGSALYGTGAIGGVVNMVTRQPEHGHSISARLYGGAHTLPRYEQWKYRDHPSPMFGADVRYASASGPLSVAISGGIRQSESYRDLDDRVGGYAFLRTTWKAVPSGTLKAFLLASSEEAQNTIYWESLSRATFPSGSQNPHETLISRKLSAGVEWLQVFSPNTFLTIRPTLYVTDFYNRISGIRADSNASTAVAANTEAQLTWLPVADVVLTSGLSTRLNHVRSDIYGSNIQELYSAYSQLELSGLSNLTLTLGGRFDYEHTASLAAIYQFSPKAGATYRVTEDFTLRASVGRGFRAPTVAERYARIRYGPFAVQPNPSLMSELAWSYETGASLNLKEVLPASIDIALFGSELWDLIEPTFTLSSPDLPIQFLNVTRARILGVELVGRVFPSNNIVAEVGVTLMDPRDLNLESVLKYRSTSLLYCRGTWNPVDGVTLQADYRFSNRVVNIDPMLVNLIPDADARVSAHVVDARIQMRIGAVQTVPVTASLIGRNIFDYYYSEMPANLAPTRALMFQVQYN